MSAFVDESDQLVDCAVGTLSLKESRTRKGSAGLRCEIQGVRLKAKKSRISALCIIIQDREEQTGRVPADLRNCDSQKRRGGQ